MIKISSNQLDEGLFLSSSVSDCRSFIDCLFGKVPTHDSEKDKCKLFQFRKAFESDSPVLYKRFKELADYDEIIYIFNTIERMDGSRKKRNARIKFQDLDIFAQVSIIALYPLYLANGMTVPFLRLEEINKIEKKFLTFSNKKVKKEIKKFKLIDREWFNWIFSVSTNFNDYEKFGDAIILIIYLFVMGIKERSLPCLQTMDNEEKKAFFENIEEAINKRG